MQIYLKIAIFQKIETHQLLGGEILTCRRVSRKIAFSRYNFQFDRYSNSYDVTKYNNKTKYVDPMK